jgi:hypothetical protein
MLFLIAAVTERLFVGLLVEMVVTLIAELLVVNA